MRRLAELSLAAFAATAGVEWPAPGGVERLRWADLLAALAVLALGVAWARGQAPRPRGHGTLACGLGLALRPAGLSRTGLLAAWLLVPFLILWLDGDRLAGQARGPLLALLGSTLALTLTRTLLAVPFALLTMGATRRALRLGAGAVLLLAALASMRLDVHGSGDEGIRWRIARSAVARARRHPLLGAGPAAPAAEAAWPGPADELHAWDAHSTLLDLAATRGLPAAALFAGTAALAWRAARRSGDRVLQAALAAVLFDALTIDLADFRHVWLLFGLAAAPAPQGG